MAMTGMACAALNAFVLLSTLAWRDGGGVAVAKTVKNDIDSIDSWHYLTRFAFMPVPEHKVDMADQNQKYGLFEFEVWYPSGTRPVLGLYFNGARIAIFKSSRNMGAWRGDTRWQASVTCPRVDRRACLPLQVSRTGARSMGRMKEIA